MENRINSKLRRSIYDAIKNLGDFMGEYQHSKYANDLNVVDFLKQIWDLPAMRSEDPRFKNAEADAVQHLINNDDWDIDFTFLVRFNLLLGAEEYFVKFLEVVVSPSTRKDQQEILTYVDVINNYLKTVRCELAIAGHIDGLPQYRFSYELNKHRDISADIPVNSIKVFLETPHEYPCFVLDQDIWDDFGFQTRYKLYYHSHKEDINLIGQIRILNTKDANTYQTLPEQFSVLDSHFVSLGQSPRYYENLKKLMPEECKSFLYAMRDVACFPRFREGTENLYGYEKSLVRYDEAKQALEMAQYLIAGYELEDKIDFIFNVQMPYDAAPLGIRFNFGNLHEMNSFSRIYALIGNNGVGKTTVLSKLAQAIVENDKSKFRPHPPLFAKVLATSYSIFDNFFKRTHSSFNYQYCGIQKETGGLMNEEEISHRRTSSFSMIHYYKRERDLNRILNLILGKELCKMLLDETETVSEQLIEQHYNKLSSGQSMLMNLAIEMLAHIRTNTLILIDEPEVHLHPKGITLILRMIDWFCEKYSSCCVMATHSSLIVQELMSKNVIILDRDEDGTPFVRNMCCESLGENLTTITEDIFGRREEEPLYFSKIQKMVQMNVDFDKAVRIIQNSDVPINMHLYLLLDKFLRHE